MRILITGGTGFIGSSLIKKLANSKHQILALTRQKKEKYKNIFFYKCDLNKKQSYKKKIENFKPECLVHLAWEGIPNFSKYNCHKNIKNSKTLIKVILKNKSCKKIIVSGSCFEILKNKGKSDEQSKISNNNFFSKSKNDFRIWLKNLNKKYIFDYIWLRIFYVYGPGQRSNSLIPYVINSIKNNKQPYISNYSNVIDFIYIADLIKIFKFFINKKSINGIFNVGSGKPVKVYNICKLIEYKINKKNIYFKRKSFKAKKIRIYFWSNKKKLIKIMNNFNFTNASLGLSKTISFYNKK
jgi:nucleoside-diphosphate-sugar epimerase